MQKLQSQKFVNMNYQDNQLSLLDLLTIISFIIGVANYAENVDQSTLQEIMQKAVNNIHAHLEMQDAKLNKIWEVLSIDH